MELKRNELLFFADCYYNQKDFNKFNDDFLFKKWNIKKEAFIKKYKAFSDKEKKEIEYEVKRYWEHRKVEQYNNPIIVQINNLNLTVNSLEKFLILEIEKYAIKYGSLNKLSMILSNSSTYIAMIFKRKEISKLLELYEKCQNLDKGK